MGKGKTKLDMEFILDSPKSYIYIIKHAVWTNHSISNQQIYLYLLESWGTKHLQKGTLWLFQTSSFSLCFLIADEPREMQLHWVVLRSYLCCPHSHFFHLSDLSVLKNYQLYKEEGINMLSKNWGSGRKNCTVVRWWFFLLSIYP